MARGRHDYEKKVIAVESEGYQDLHGRILMNDNFEDTPFKWAGSGSGTHFEARQARAAYNGSYGAELDLTSDAPPAARSSRIQRYVPIDITERFELELFWRANVIARMRNMNLWIEYYAGAQYNNILIQYWQPTAEWRYMNAASGIVPIPGAAQLLYDNGWNELTLSADFATDHHIRMKSNNMEINMGALPCRHNDNLTGAHVTLWLEVSITTANQLLVSIDDAILKELEV